LGAQTSAFLGFRSAQKLEKANQSEEKPRFANPITGTTLTHKDIFMLAYRLRDG